MVEWQKVEQLKHKKGRNIHSKGGETESKNQPTLLHLLKNCSNEKWENPWIWKKK